MRLEILTLTLVVPLTLANLAGAQVPVSADRLLTTAIDQLQAGDPQGAHATLQPLRERRDAPAAAFDLLLALEEAYGTAGPGAQSPLPSERLREDSIVRYVARAEALLLRRRPQNAIEVLPFVPEATRSADLDRLRRVAGRAALLAGQLPDAIRWLAAVAEGHPATTLALAQAQYRAGEAEKALGLLEPIVGELVSATAEPQNRGLAVSLLLEYGRIASSTGNAAGAIPALERASKLSPNAAAVWQTLAQALLVAGRREAGEHALARFRELTARAQQPSTGVPLAETAEQKAEREKRQSVVAAGIANALALAKGGQQEEALAAVRDLMRAAPGELEPHLFTIAVLVGLDRLDEALAASEEAVAAFPGHPEALYHRAIVRLRRNESAAAEKDLRSTLAAAPTHLLALNNLAVLLEQREATAEAITLLERVLAVDVENTVARENLKRLREKKPS